MFVHPNPDQEFLSNNPFCPLCVIQVPVCQAGLEVCLKDSLDWLLWQSFRLCIPTGSEHIKPLGHSLSKDNTTHLQDLTTTT